LKDVLKRLRVGASVDGNNLVVCFADTGIGIASVDICFVRFSPARPVFFIA